MKTCEQKFTARREHLEYFVKFVFKLKQFIKCCAYLGIYASINYLAEIYEQLTIEQYKQVRNDLKHCLDIKMLLEGNSIVFTK